MAIDTLGANALASNSVTSAKIADGAVVAADVADGSVTTAKLAADAVTAAKLADNAVVSANLSAGTLEGSGVNLGRRNLLINGEFQIFQRAASATNPGGGYDTADRWRSSQNSGGLGNYNAEQSTDTPVGFGNSYKLTNTDATTQSANVSAYIEQYLEGQNVQHLNYGSSSAVKLTASFHVKSSVTGIYGCFLGDGESGKSNVQTYTINSANTWEKKVITFNGDTQTALANDSSKELSIGFVLGAGTSYQTSSTNTWASGGKISTSSQTQWPQTNGATFFMTGIQLEVGDTATDFEHHSVGEELRECKRYYEVFDTNVYPVNYSNQTLQNFYWTEQKRTQPTITATGNGGGAALYAINTSGGYIYHSSPNYSSVSGLRGDAEL